MSTPLNYSLPTGSRLTHAQRESLRNALGSARKGIFLTPLQRQAIREICRAAGDSRLRPEQSLIVFKVCLFQAADDLKIPPGAERANLLERFVSLFIEEMYQPEPDKASEDGDGRGRMMGGIIPAGNREPPAAHL